MDERGLWPVQRRTESARGRESAESGGSAGGGESEVGGGGIRRGRRENQRLASRGDASPAGGNGSDACSTSMGCDLKYCALMESITVESRPPAAAASIRCASTYSRRACVRSSWAR